ncbi:putative acyl carrier protein [Vibrio phage 501E54-1]|nr:putative acyl carrier protein [Vibrio phage 501E54-1]
MNLFGWEIYKKSEDTKPTVTQDTMSRLKGVCEGLLGFSDGLVFSHVTDRYDLKMDSLDSVELLLAVEEEFDIDIPDELWEKCSNIGDLVILINLKRRV